MAGSDPVSPVKSPDRVTGVTLSEWTQPTNQRPVWVTSDQSEGEGRGRGMSVAGAGVVTSVVSESVRVQSSPEQEPRAETPGEQRTSLIIRINITIYSDCHDEKYRGDI